MTTKRSSSQHSILLGLCSTSLLLAACGAAGPESGELVDSTSAAVSVSGPQDIVGAQHGYEWQKGWATAVMTPAASSVCFLSYVGGTFAGTADKVQISNLNGTLLLSGSGSGDKRAGAFCVTGVTGETEQSWTTGDLTKDLGAAAGRTCFLTAVWGNLGGTGEEIFTKIKDGRWILSGNSAAGSARCIATSNFSPMSMTAGNSSEFTNARQASPWGPKMCALTRVSGYFRGGSVDVFESRNNDLNLRYSWSLRATANPFPFVLGGNPSASGMCIQ